MFTIHCTSKLRATLKVKPVSVATATTRLGNWYANHLSGPRSPLICISERTFLPVVVRSCGAAELPRALAEALGKLLADLQIPKELIEQERLAMAHCSWAKTESRSVLGVLNEQTHLAHILRDERLPLPALNRELAENIVKSQFPIDLTREAFGLEKRDLRRRSKPPQDEPGTEEDMGWVEAGGQLILAAGFTEAGFPYGLTAEEYREGNFEADRHEGWARAKYAMERVCSAAFEHEVEVGFVKVGGTGISRDAYRAVVEYGRNELDVYALVPNRFAAADYNQHALTELKLLSALGQRELRFRVPKVLGALRDEGGLILVEELLAGYPLDLRREQQGSVRPLAVVAELAAQVHAIPVESLPDGLLAPKDCRSHGESLIPAPTEHPLLITAREWMHAHLPPPEPGVLLHGDLLGQNVHLGFDEPHGLLDWERAEIGDPAHELAILTRGVRQPFKNPNGLDRLIEEYATAGGRPLTRTRVQFFELGLLVHQLQEAITASREVEDAENRLRSLLNRLIPG